MITKKALHNRVMQALENGEDLGFCTHCGYEDFLEADAGKCECPECGNNTFYGTLDLLYIMS